MFDTFGKHPTTRTFVLKKRVSMVDYIIAAVPLRTKPHKTKTTQKNEIQKNGKISNGNTIAKPKNKGKSKQKIQTSN